MALALSARYAALRAPTRAVRTHLMYAQWLGP